MLAGDDSGGSVVVSTLNGTGGVGKTSLAVYVANQVLDDFPDGQLYADLHGLGSGAPAEADAVMIRFLRRMGLHAHEIPSDLEERQALYRSMLAQRRLLILLGNALDSAQIGPLLPGSGGARVLITSHSTLPGLDGAHRVTVNVLSQAESQSLFSRIAGEAVAGAEPEALAEVLRVCAGLPLAASPPS